MDKIQLIKVFPSAEETIQELPILPMKMHASDATAMELVANASGLFGADLLRFPVGGKVQMHTHIGNHILYVTRGMGYLITPEERQELNAGVIYFVPSNVPHAIEAHDNSVLELIAIGDDRRPPDSKERLDLV